MTHGVNELGATPAPVSAAPSPPGSPPVPAPGSAPLTAAPGRVPLQSERAYAAVRDMIVTLRLPPGAPVNEERLSAELAIGRTPLRDALKRLESETLVVIYPRQGTFVTRVDITDHGLIADVRRQLEGHAARRAAEHLTEGDRVVLCALLPRMRADTPGSPPPPADGSAPRPTDGSATRPVAGSGTRLAGAAPTLPTGGGDRAGRMQLDTEIHRAVYRCAHNRYLSSTLEHFYNLSLRIWYLFLDRLPEVDHAAHHVPMIEAILAGDADRAHELAVEHVDVFERSVRAAI